MGEALMSAAAKGALSNRCSPYISSPAELADKPARALVVHGSRSSTSAAQPVDRGGQSHRAAVRTGGLNFNPLDWG
jgi:hypothetical protein